MAKDIDCTGPQYFTNIYGSNYYEDLTTTIGDGTGVKQMEPSHTGYGVEVSPPAVGGTQVEIDAPATSMSRGKES